MLLHILAHGRVLRQAYRLGGMLHYTCVPRDPMAKVYVQTVGHRGTKVAVVILSAAKNLVLHRDVPLFLSTWQHVARYSGEEKWYSGAVGRDSSLRSVHHQLS